MSTTAVGAAASTDRRATYQDVIDAPPHKVAEVMDGELHLHPRPAPVHSLSSSMLGGSLAPHFGTRDGTPGGWWILDEPELHFGDDVLVPDLAGWRRGRMPDLPEQNYFTLPSDWVCEVLSPSTRKMDLGTKRAIYAREGVAYLWFVDPTARMLEAFALRDNFWVVIETVTGDAEVSLPPFDAISFSLADLWPYPEN